MNKEELEKYIEKDFLPSLLSKFPNIPDLEAENARLKADAQLVVKHLGEACADNLRLKADVVELADALKLASEVGIKVADEVTRLKAEVERLRASSFVTAVPVEQYERLIKAGDAMYYWLGVCGRRNNSTGDDWLRAKKGAMLQSEQFELERKNLRWVVFNAKEGKPSV